MNGIESAHIFCAVTIPGSGSLAPVLLMNNGTYKTDPQLTGAARAQALRWVKEHGDAFCDFAREYLGL